MKLALGTVQFGLHYGVANASGKVSQLEAELILRRAKACGLDTLDTAVAYGESESILGKLGIQDWKTISKIPTVPVDCENVYQWALDQTRQSLDRLGVSQLHGLLLHRPGQLLESIGPALYDALQSIKAQGLSKKIGVSIYETTELDALMERYNIDLIQAPLNILDRSLVTTGWAKRLHDAGVEVHTRSAFLQGLLLLSASLRPTKFAQWAKVWGEWERWLHETGQTPLQACLRYVHSLPEIDRVVVGVDTVSQLDQIIEAATGELPSLPVFEPLQDARLINPATWNRL